MAQLSDAIGHSSSLRRYVSCLHYLVLGQKNDHLFSNLHIARLQWDKPHSASIGIRISPSAGTGNEKDLPYNYALDQTQPRHLDWLDRTPTSFRSSTDWVRFPSVGFWEQLNGVSAGHTRFTFTSPRAHLSQFTIHVATTFSHIPIPCSQPAHSAPWCLQHF